jgi:hypothetical protein
MRTRVISWLFAASSLGHAAEKSVWVERLAFWAAPELRRLDQEVAGRAKQGASYQVKDLLFQNLASRNYRVLQ